MNLSRRLEIDTNFENSRQPHQHIPGEKNKNIQDSSANYHGREAQHPLITAGKRPQVNILADMVEHRGKYRWYPQIPERSGECRDPLHLL